MEYNHSSVLFEECLAALNTDSRPSGIFLDGTLGGAGHSEGILSRLDSAGFLLGIDQDKDVFDNANKVLAAFKGRYKLVRGNFSNISQIAQENGISGFDGVLLDLGVSSYQLDNPERGFSYMADSALDMRMNEDSQLSAFDIVNHYKEAKLNEIIFKYGEERWAKRIAQFIIAERQKKPIATTFELVSVIKKAIPKGAREEGPHPAKRTFQAIRIEVNNELGLLKGAINDIVSLLNPGGRLAVISFHSLEDRIVKNTLQGLERPCTCPPQLPVCICKKTARIKIITRKPILPSQEEIERNHRSRSAKLRVAEKL